MKRKVAIMQVASLLLAFALPVMADQSATMVVKSQVDPRVQDLQNEIVQLRDTLRERSVDRRQDTQEWQQNYEEKLAEIREREEFRSRYLSHE